MAASPVTQANVARESTIVRKMYEAIMYRNNNAAANLLMRRSGGPASLPTLLRSIGDRVTRIDDYEGHVTERPLPADSSASRAIIETVRRIISSPVLPIAERRLWESWMEGNIVRRSRLRASLPNT
jgi:beta-lactamase class A